MYVRMEANLLFVDRYVISFRNFLLVFLLLDKVLISGSSVFRVKCRTEGFDPVLGKFGREEHWLCLRPVGTKVQLLALDEDPQCNLEATKQDNDVTVEGHDVVFNVTMAVGYPSSDTITGSAEGYIGEDHQFYGILHIGNRILYADPYGKDTQINKSFGFWDDDRLVVTEKPRRDHVQPRSVSKGSGNLAFGFNLHQQKPPPGVARARICELLLLADKEFYEKDANSSLTHVVKRMVHAVSQADTIFRNADIDEDGVPDNIGFSVKYILVLTSNETNTRIFGNLLDDQVIDGRSYLMKFARLRRLSDVCLGVAFSGHAFYNRTLGLSFTSLGDGIGGSAGGMCDRRAFGKSFNTLVIAHATMDDNHRVPERVADLTLAHELGHSFGAHHDEYFPNPECKGYIMSSQSVSGEASTHFEFSICSKRLISASLSSMSYCLVEEVKPYCGNGIVETGEACDCGLPSSCHRRDPCCTPRTGAEQMLEKGVIHVEGCSVAPTAKCHPSQGVCCKANCQLANLTRNGINCEWLSLQCPSRDGRCGLGGLCAGDGSCHASECALLGLAECQCKYNLGGTLGARRMCGICCLVPETEDIEARCVSAERAAYEALQRNIRLPSNWPHSHYSGPNMTLRICAQKVCVYALIRAWKSGGPCVTMNTVGFCNHKGVCTRKFQSPNINRFPDLMNVRRAALKKKSSADTLPDNFKYITAFIFILVIIYK